MGSGSTACSTASRAELGCRYLNTSSSGKLCIGRGEPDPEIQDLLRASEGTNFGLRYLPGALGYDLVADRGVMAAEMAAEATEGESDGESDSESESVEEVDQPTELIERSVRRMNDLRTDGWKAC